MPIVTPATKVLDSLSIPYRLFEHIHPPATIEQAALERGQEVSQVIRSILFRHDHAAFVMVLVSSRRQVSWRQVRAHLGVSRLSLASEAEVHRVTGYKTGTVNPLGISTDVRILADEAVFAPHEISIGSGVHGTAIILASADLRQALGRAEIGAFARTP